MRGWEMQLKRFLQRFSACSSLHFTAIHTIVAIHNQNNWEFRVQFSILRWERLRDAIQKIPTKIQLDVANNVWINFCVKIFPPPHKLVLPNLRHKFNQKSDRNRGPINPELKKSRAVLSNLLKSPLQSISNQNNWETDATSCFTQCRAEQPQINIVKSRINNQY